MKDLCLFDEYKVDLGLGNLNGISTGTFLVPLDSDKDACVIATKNRYGWDHVSFHLQDKSSECILRTMNNEEMQIMRNMFFEEDELVQEFHPCKKDYINNHSYTLHMWRLVSDSITKPNTVLLSKNMPSKVLNTPNQKSYNIRFYEDDEYERVNVRCLNKKKNIVKRYPTWEDMCTVKKIVFGEDVACTQFRYSDMNSDYSVDIYKPRKKELICPPSILVGSKAFGKLI